MASVEKGVMITPPNEQLRNGDPGSSSPLGRQASQVQGSNSQFHNGNANNGFMPMTKQASQVKGSNESLKFDIKNAKMPQPPSVTQPGEGGIPVNPFMGPGGSTTSLRQPDRAPKSK